MLKTRTNNTPDTNAFVYDYTENMLTICNKTNSKIKLNPKDVVEFMYSIGTLTSQRYKPYNGEDIPNSIDALRHRLKIENYVKLPGPIDCEVWGCFNDNIENLLMLEIIYPDTGFRHINVAVDLSKFQSTVDISSSLVLMWKDKVICYYDKGSVKITGVLPYGLYLTEDKDFDSSINNITNFQSWCSRRMLTLDREHAKVILNSVGLRQAITDVDRMRIALQYKCLSLQDCYWVKSVNDKTVWKDVNLFKHSLNDAVPVSLQGANITLQNVNCISQDIATNGVAPKAWVREGQNVFLYKGDVGRNSVQREIAASNIISSLGIINTIKYTEGKYKEATVSICRLYSSEEISLVSLEDYVTTHDITGSFLSGLKNTILAAYLIGDSDRHCGNVFFEYSHENGLLEVGPMMDFNHAFEAEDGTSAVSLLAWNIHETLSEAVKRLFRVDELKYKLKIAEMYSSTEPDNIYWMFVIKQLKKVIN